MDPRSLYLVIATGDAVRRPARQFHPLMISEIAALRRPLAMT
jgi:hypothetical protein